MFQVWKHTEPIQNVITWQNCHNLKRKKTEGIHDYQASPKENTERTFWDEAKSKIFKTVQEKEIMLRVVIQVRLRKQTPQNK